MLQSFLQFLLTIFSITSILLTIGLTFKRLKKRQSSKIPQLEKPLPILRQYQFLQLSEGIDYQIDQIEKLHNNTSAKTYFFSVLSNILEISFVLAIFIGGLFILANKEHSHFSVLLLGVSIGLFLYAYFVNLAVTKIFEFSTQMAERSITKIELKILQVKNEIRHLDIIHKEMIQNQSMRPTSYSDKRDRKI